jgi:rhodanese-related sulfurtransferase
MNLIDRNALKRLIDSRDPIVLLEALPERYFSAGHLPGARLFPHDQAAALAPQLLADKQAKIVVYCASDTCQNSHVAAAVLRKLGYADVAVYAGGKKDWEQSGLPLETV